MNNPTCQAPVLIAVAPNGARYTKNDHPALPISARELATTAVDCAEAGAAMIHLHVRDENGQHSLEPSHYRPAIDAIQQAVGDAMLIQITSEAAGIYKPEDQIRLLDKLQLSGLSVSIAVREFFAGAGKAASGFLGRLQQTGALIQYILYNRHDVRRYQQLLHAGIIPGGQHFVLFVLGHYPHSSMQPESLNNFLSEFEVAVPWMACAFGSNAIELLSEAAARGGHTRIGFENGWLLPDRSIAPDNASLVRALTTRITESGGEVARIAEFHSGLKT
ncbi:MAG: 3-keto-5-aminohexanoate cleavage protein [Gammaproteobacteria bacterium]|nr:3-keto-5-aminohexanoate cleavage protein [Gammaproteobacteria bacterium]